MWLWWWGLGCVGGGLGDHMYTRLWVGGAGAGRDCGWMVCLFWGGGGGWMDGGVYVYVCAAIHDLNGCGGVYVYVLVGVCCRSALPRAQYE